MLRAEYGGPMRSTFAQRRRRYTARTLGRAPGFALTAVGVTALGIGATTAAFTTVDHVLIRPFPYAEPDRLVKLYEDHSSTGGAIGKMWDVAPANYRDWKSMSSSFETMGAYHSLSANLVGQGGLQRIDASAVTGELFSALGVKPLLGRLFTV